MKCIDLETVCLSVCMYFATIEVIKPRDMNTTNLPVWDIRVSVLFLEYEGMTQQGEKCYHVSH
jgi:hypothetical protein